MYLERSLHRKPEQLARFFTVLVTIKSLFKCFTIIIYVSNIIMEVFIISMIQ